MMAKKKDKMSTKDYEKVKFGKRNTKGAYDDVASIADRRFVPEVF